MIINATKQYCYRIIHRDNLRHLLKHGFVSKHHKNADPDFTSIGNTEIIDVRSTTKVKINGFGNIGEYIPFYFTTRSIMLYNIVTGYQAPKVPRRAKNEIIAIRCKIQTLAKQRIWFFTDGQANDDATTHYHDLAHLENVDWECIHKEDFTKSASDYDRARRYQAEFLIHDHVPVECIDAICVYDAATEKWVNVELGKVGLDIPVIVQRHYFFD